MLELISRKGRKLSEILAPFRARYFITGELNTPVARRRAEAAGAEGAVRGRGDGLASRRHLRRRGRLALQRPPVEHGAAAAAQPRSALAGADGAQARRGARPDPDMRARELGIAIGELEPGALDAITDVAGVRVGHTTLREGDAIRTGVTVVVPPELPCFAGAHRLNGNGELTGLEWVRESGLLTSQIGLTNTYSVGRRPRRDRRGARARRVGSLAPAGRRRDVRRLPERHRGDARARGASLRRARVGRRRAGGRRAASGRAPG